MHEHAGQNNGTKADSPCQRLRRRPRSSNSSFVHERASSGVELKIDTTKERRGEGEKGGN